MTNSEKRFPGLKGMLVATLAVFMLVVAWITVTKLAAQTSILGLVDAEPTMGLIAVLAMMVVFAVSVYGGAGILIIMWVAYGIFLLVRHFWKKKHQEEVAPDDIPI